MRRILTFVLGVVIGQWLAFSSTVSPADYQSLQDSGFQVLVRDPFNILYLGMNGGNVPNTGANPALNVRGHACEG